MRKVLWSVLMVLVLAVPSWAALPEHTGFVTDVAGMLSQSQHDQLEAQLVAYEAQTGNELAVAIVSGLDGYATIEQYANALFHQWGIGKADKDNGILFLWDPLDRKIRIEVGYGLEPALPDGRAGQIIREVITPRFRSEQYAEGVFTGVNAIIEAVAVRSDPPAPKAKGDSVVSGVLFILAVVLVVVIVFWVFVFIFRANQKAEREAEEQRRLAYRLHQEWEATNRRVKKVDRGYVRPAEPDVEPVVTAASNGPRSYQSRSSSRSSSSSSGYDSGSSWSSSDSGSSFGGGDSGGGGASGDY